MKFRIFLTILLVAILTRIPDVSADEACNCFDCFRNQICELNANIDTSLKVSLKVLLDKNMIDQRDYDSVKADTTIVDADPCIRNKIEYFVSYLFDLPKPTPAKQCINSTFCGSDDCFNTLEGFQDWKILKEGCITENFFRMTKNTLNETLSAIKSTLMHTRDYSKESETIKNVMKQECQPQKALTRPDSIQLVLRLFSKFFMCEVNQPFDAANNDPNNMNYEGHIGNVTAPPRNDGLENMYEISSSMYLGMKARLLLLGTFEIHMFKMSLEKVPQDACGPFYDVYYLDKLFKIQLFQRSILGCLNCQQVSPIEGCDLPNLAAHIHENNMRTQSLFESFKYLLKCHAFDEACLARSSIDRSKDAFHFLIDTFKDIVGCGRCSQQVPLLCPDGSNCEKTVILPVSTKYGAISGLFSTLMTCKDGIKGLLSSDSEVNGMNLLHAQPFAAEIVSFYENMVDILMYEEKVAPSLSDDVGHTVENLKEEDCSSESSGKREGCKGFFIKRAVKTLMEFIKQTNPSCKVEKTISGIPICQKNLFEDWKRNCKLDLLPIKHLMFATIGLLSDCEGDPFRSQLKKCSFLASLLGKKDRIFGDIVTLEEFYKVKEKIGSSLNIDLKLKDSFENIFKIEVCDQPCPPSHQFCESSKKCVPEWILCDTSSSSSSGEKQAFMLPAMESSDSFSKELLVESFSTTDISVLHIHEADDNSGTWQYEIDGTWNSVNELPHSIAVKLSLSTKIRYFNFQPGRDYGLKVLHFFKDTSSRVNGERADSPINVIRKVALMFVYPGKYSMDLTVFKDIFTVEMDEDQYVEPHNGISFSELFSLKSDGKVQKIDIPENYRYLVPYEELSKFYEKNWAFLKSMPVIKLNTDISDYGSLVIGNDYNHIHGYLSSKGKYTSAIVELGRITFFPKHNFYGNVTIQFEVCNCSETSKDVVSKTFQMKLIVRPVNDVPQIKRTGVYLPPISYDLAKEPNNGFTAKELFHHVNVYDAESGFDVGIAVFLTPTDKSIGNWEYQFNNTWKELSVTNGEALFKAFFHKDATEEDRMNLATSYVQYITFNSSTRFRFNMNNNSFWREIDALKSAFFVFSAWDLFDKVATGFHNVTLMTIQTAESYSLPMIGMQLRRGCDGRAGSVAQIDSCGKCGGKGDSCLGCDNVKDSGAIIDDCGECTGGSTNRLFNQKKDCAGTCGQSSLDDCGQCQITNSKKRRIFKDCNGVCFGGAKIDKCGVCSGGNTGKKMNADVDVCGVCSGDGSSCKGCDGVAASGKVKDLCGNCLSPKDPSFNKQCVRIKSFSPTSSPSTGKIEIHVSGTGFTSDEISCSFSNVTLRQIYNVRSIRGSRTLSMFKLKIPSMKPGYYTLKCWVGDADGEELSTMQLFVYEAPKLSLTYVTPDKISYNDFTNVTVKGSGFLKTGEEVCVVYDLKSRFATFPLTVADGKNAECHIKTPKKSINGYIALSFSKLHWNRNLLRALTALPFKIHAPIPRVVRAQFSDNFKEIQISFNEKASCVSRRCSGIFTNNWETAFGQKFKVQFRNPKTLIIRLGWKSTVKPNDVISLKPSTIKPLGEKIFSESPQTEILILQPKNMPAVPTVKIAGPRNIGPCSMLKLSASLSKGGIRGKSEFNWDVSFPQSTDVSTLGQKTKDSLNAIKNKLSNIDKSRRLLRFKYDQLDTISGVDYEFKLNVSNFLGQTSETVSHLISRTIANAPAITIFGGNEQTFKTGYLNKIKAKSRMPKCLSHTEKSLFDFTWEVDDTSVLLDEKSKHKAVLYIKPGTLMSGESYTFSLKVALKENPFVYTTTTVKVTATGEPLIPKIRGGNRKMSTNDIVKLDASRSRDPDKSKEREIFQWQCFDSTESECFIPNQNDTNRYTRLELAQQAKVTIDKGILQPGENYTFKLTYRKGNRESVQATRIDVTDSEPPKVFIFPQRKKKESVMKKVRVRAYVRCKESGAKIWLESVAEDGYGVINIDNPEVLLTPLEVFKNKPGLFPFDIIFNENVLTGGTQYKFLLFAQAGDNVGYGQIEFVTNSPPTEGLFTSDVLNGTALTTQFLLDASQGWEDDADDYPLTYSFGYVSSKGHVHYLLPPSSESIVSTTLPSGELESNYKVQLFVEVSDIHGASTTTYLNVTVYPVGQVDEDLLKNMSALIEEAKGSDDTGAVLAVITNTLAVFENEIGNKTGDDLLVGKTFREFKENSTRDVISIVDTVQDVETQNIVIKNLRETTNGGESFSPSVKLSVGLKMSEVVNKQVFSSGASASRKRRNVEGSESNGKTKEEVEDVLVTMSNTLDENDFSNTSMASKKTFTDLTHTLLTSLCNNIAYGESPLQVVSKYATLQVFKHPFTNVDTSPVSVGCGDNCDMMSEVLLGEDLQSQYRSWNCDGEDECTGACIGSVIYPYDIFSKNNSVPKRTANMVSVRLFNPTTSAIIESGVQSKPSEYYIPFNNQSAGKYGYDCEIWDDATGAWSSTNCYRMNSTKLIRGIHHAICRCYSLGVVSIFEVEGLAIGNTITQRQPPSHYAEVEVRFLHTLSTIIEKSGSGYVSEAIKSSLVTQMNIEDWRISNVTVLNNTYAVFTFLPPDEGVHSNALVTFDADIASLRELVANGTLLVEFEDGSSALVDKSYIEVTLFGNANSEVGTSNSLQEKCTVFLLFINLLFLYVGMIL